jgi:SAM-dependent methyltransferase
MTKLNKGFLQIDEDGFLCSGEKRITTRETGASALKALRISDERTLKTDYIRRGTKSEVIIEAFDEPYVAAQVAYEDSSWWIFLPYDVKFRFDFHSLSIDEWDRFHGYAENGIPFVLTKKAQAEFFKLLEAFDDESITWHGEKVSTPPYWPNHTVVKDEKYWDDIYKTETKPGWDLNDAAEALKDMLPRLKMPRCRVLVLGCGEGHDAAFFAQNGHIVTGVDISPEAITRAQDRYAPYGNLKFIKADIFNLPKAWTHSFDLIFEHTCYCAINPADRRQLVKIWTQLLSPRGQIMGIFFTMEKRAGPPFGGTEWELRKRLQNKFSFLFWGRWQASLPRRQGRELFVLAQKKD